MPWSKLLRAWSRTTALGVAMSAPGLIFAPDQDVIPDVISIQRDAPRPRPRRDRAFRHGPRTHYRGPVLRPGQPAARSRGEARPLQPPARRRVLDRRSRGADCRRTHPPSGRLAVMPITRGAQDTLTSPLLPGFSCPVHTLFRAALKGPCMSHMDVEPSAILDVTARVSACIRNGRRLRSGARRAAGRRRMSAATLLCILLLLASCSTAFRDSMSLQDESAMAACNRVSLPRRTSISALDNPWRSCLSRAARPGSMPRLPCPLGGSSLVARRLRSRLATFGFDDRDIYQRVNTSRDRRAQPRGVARVGRRWAMRRRRMCARKCSALGCRLTKRSGTPAPRLTASGRSPSLHRSKRVLSPSQCRLARLTVLRQIALSLGESQQTRTCVLGGIVQHVAQERL